jgi:hypothetical protein
VTAPIEVMNAHFVHMSAVMSSTATASNPAFDRARSTPSSRCGAVRTP